jgi:hypothetical protein
MLYERRFALLTEPGQNHDTRKEVEMLAYIPTLKKQSLIP